MWGEEGRLQWAMGRQAGKDSHLPWVPWVRPPPPLHDDAAR